jgi:superfamily II DNA or RNA helicase
LINEERRVIQLEALDALRNNNFKGIIILPTGTGKSWVMIEALREVYKPGMRVLYTCDSRRLRDSDFNKELEKWNADEFCGIIEKQCYAAAYKKEGQYYDILLADEGDYGLTPEYSKLFANNTFEHIIFVSATLEPSKRQIAKGIAPIVYERKLKEIEDDGVVNKSQFWYVPYLLNPTENAMYVEYNNRFRHLLNEKNGHVINDPPRSRKQIDSDLKFLSFERLHFLAGLESSAYICGKLIADIQKRDENAKMLIFCGLTSQADKVSMYTYHGKSKETNWLDAFNHNEIKELAVCGKIDRGINLEGANTVIMESVTSSETKMIQKLGRGKRLAVDEVLQVYFPIPYFRPVRDAHGKPTIVLQKIHKACAKIGIGNAKTYILKLDNG